MRALIVLLVASCTADYKTPAVGASAAAAVEMCRNNVDLPCGWVYQCGEFELCLPWEDRAEIPKLRETAESLYGQCSLSTDARFAGTPICWYQCPSARGCNAMSGCFCLEPAP